MRSACGVVVLTLVAVASCGHRGDRAASGSGDEADDPSSVTLRFAYSSEKKAWLDEAIPAFLATHPKTPSGKSIKVVAKSFG